MINKKFKLTKETKEEFGIKLYRIEAISEEKKSLSGKKVSVKIDGTEYSATID